MRQLPGRLWVIAWIAVGPAGLAAEPANTWREAMVAGKSALDEGAITGAIDHYERALALVGNQETAGTDLVENLRRLVGLYRMTGRLAEAIDALTRVLDREPATSPERAALLAELAWEHQRAGHYSTAETLLREAVRVHEQIRGGDPPALARILRQLSGLVRTLRPEDGEAEALLVRALELTELRLGASHPETIRLLANLAAFYGQTGRRPSAVELYSRAIELERGRKHPDQDRQLHVLRELAGQHQLLEELDQAEQRYRELLALQQAHLGSRHPACAETFGALGMMFARQQRFEEALQQIERALAIHVAALGPEHPSTVASRNALRYVVGRRGDEKQLAELGPLREARCVAPSPADPTREEVQRLRREGAAARARGEFDAAMQLAVRRVEVERRASGPDSMLTAAGVAEIAGLLEAQQRWDEALPYRMEHLRITERAAPAGDPRRAAAYHDMSSFFRSVGDHEQARGYLVQEIELREARDEAGPELARALEDLAQMDERLKDGSAAEKHYGRAAELWARIAGSGCPERTRIRHSWPRST